MRPLATAISAQLLFLLMAGAVAAAPQQGAAPRVLRDEGDRPLPFKDAPSILRFLREAEIVHSEELGSGTTRPERITLAANGVQARAIFRTVAFQDDNIRLREGPDYLEFFDRAIHELAAYDLALILGIDAIPPVVKRTIGGRQGTVQIWIEGAFNEGERSARRLEPPNASVWRAQQQTMRVFDALVANTDRNSGNRIYDPDWNLWMIDHTRAFQRPRGEDDFGRVQQLPATLLEALRGLDHDTVRRTLGPNLESAQINSMLQRHRRLLAHIDGLIAERGAGAVVTSQSGR